MTDWQVVGLVAGLISLAVSVVGNIVQYVKKSEMEKAFRALAQGMQGQLAIGLVRAQGLVNSTVAIAKPPAEIDPRAIRDVHTLSGDVRGSIEAASEGLRGFCREYLHLHLPNAGQVDAERNKR